MSLILWMKRSLRGVASLDLLVNHLIRYELCHVLLLTFTFFLYALKPLILASLPEEVSVIETDARPDATQCLSPALSSNGALHPRCHPTLSNSDNGARLLIMKFMTSRS